MALTIIVRENLIIPSPGAYRRELLSLAIFRRQGRVPTGERRTVHFYHNRPEAVVIPRGLLHRVQAISTVRVIDRRLTLPPIDFGWRGQLRPEQAEAARVLARAGEGMLVGMPGSGKTNCGLGLVAAWRQPCLWLVHTKPLAKQALERARSLFNLPVRAFGYVGEGEEDWGTHLTVGMIQSFAKRRYHGAPQRFGTVVLDEAHHLPALTLARVLSQFPARYRIGLTATPDRSDGLAPLATAILGPTVGTISPKALLKAGRIVIPTVRIVPTSFRYHGRGDWAYLQRARAADARRNLIICTLAAGALRAGRPVMVLAELVPHARLLAAALTRRFGVPAVAVLGPTPPRHRDRAFQAVQEGRAVMVATKVADEGLDLPAVECLVLAAAGKSASRLAQQVGRIVRKARGKTGALVYDLADVHVPSLFEQAQERLRAYRSLWGDLGVRVERHTTAEGLR